MHQVLFKFIKFFTCVVTLSISLLVLSAKDIEESFDIPNVCIRYWKENLPKTFGHISVETDKYYISIFNNDQRARIPRGEKAFWISSYSLDKFFEGEGKEMKKPNEMVLLSVPMQILEKFHRDFEEIVDIDKIERDISGSAKKCRFFEIKEHYFDACLKLYSSIKDYRLDKLFEELEDALKLIEASIEKLIAERKASLEITNLEITKKIREFGEKFGEKNVRDNKLEGAIKYEIKTSLFNILNSNDMKKIIGSAFRNTDNVHKYLDNVKSTVENNIFKLDLGQYTDPSNFVKGHIKSAMRFSLLDYYAENSRIRLSKEALNLLKKGNIISLAYEFVDNSCELTHKNTSSTTTKDLKWAFFPDGKKTLNCTVFPDKLLWCLEHPNSSLKDYKRDFKYKCSKYLENKKGWKKKSITIATLGLVFALSSGRLKNKSLRNVICILGLLYEVLDFSYASAPVRIFKRAQNQNRVLLSKSEDIDKSFDQLRYDYLENKFKDITCIKLLEVLRDDVGKNKENLEFDGAKDEHKPMGILGMKILHKLQPWSMLTELIIPNNKIQDEGLKYLVAIDWKLKTLNLAQNNLTKDGVVDNICNDNLKEKWDLEYLNLSGNGIDPGDSTRIVKKAYNNYERQRDRCGKWKNVMVTRYRDEPEFISGELRQKLVSLFPKLSNRYNLMF